MTSGPSNLLSAHAYSDGNPVTGTEVQGMCLDVCCSTLDYLQTFIMPSMPLHYGLARALVEALNFMWSLLSHVGPKPVFMIILSC